MTIRFLNPGATIRRTGETIRIVEKQTRKVGIREILEFRVIRGSEKSPLWVSGAIAFNPGWILQ